MQKSKSIFSLASNTQHTEVRPEVRSQRRSSLDTFVIPGRTRLPSSRTSKSSLSSQDATNIQIAQTLLDHSMMPRSRPPRVEPAPHHAGGGGLISRLRPSPTPRPGGRRLTRFTRRHDHISPQFTPRPQRQSGMIQPAPRYSDQDASILPRHRTRETQTPQTIPHLSVTDTTDDPFEDQTDGPGDADGSRHLSRMTSTTFSMASHRLVSDSSASSGASRASDFRHEFNTLAEQHGLPLLTGSSGYNVDSNNSSRTRVAQKSHHGWVPKFLRPSSSTYSLKVQTTYKPVSKKMSLGGLHLGSKNAPTNVLSGRSLEEINVLGGRAIFVLSSDFAYQKLTLPTSLSATGTFIFKNGYNAPGIFRVSGSATTINALFDFFDHQFSDAGSPTKVEETVGTGLLPSDIEYTLPDITSVFKRIIIGLPGGLLGSVELFEILRWILVDWSSESSTDDIGPFRAKLIALAISGVSSQGRLHLIQAVLGLAAHFGFEGDKAQAAARLDVESEAQQNQPGSEIMGYRSLGTVLGPLLLGDSIDGVHIGAGSAQASEGALSQRNLPDNDQENAKKSKKQKPATVPSKLDTNAILSARLVRANLATDVMRLLLLNWKEIVKQLRDINGISSSTSRHLRSNDYEHRDLSRAVGGFTFEDSAEDTHFLDMVRGRTIPEGLRGPHMMNTKLRITSRSPMGRACINASDNGGPSRAALPQASEEHGNASPAKGNALQSTCSSGSGQRFNKASPITTGYQESLVRDNARRGSDKRTKSEVEMDAMAMGTILEPPNDTSSSSTRAPISYPISPAKTPRKQSRTGSSRNVSSSSAETPRKQPRTGSSGYGPETAFRRRVPTAAQRQPSVRLVNNPDMNKPLPSIGDAQDNQYTSFGNFDTERELHGLIMSGGKSRRSSGKSPGFVSHRRSTSSRVTFPARGSRGHAPSPAPASKHESAFPPRESSPLQDRYLTSRAIEPLPTFGDEADYQGGPKADSTFLQRPTSRETSALALKHDQISKEAKPTNIGSVKELTQKFNEVSGPTRDYEKVAQPVKAEDTPKPYANVRTIPHQHSLDDPFVSSAKSSPTRDTMIPKPAREVGHGRKAEHIKSPERTPSPPKPAASLSPFRYTQKRPSVYHLGLHDKDTELGRAFGRAGTATFNNGFIANTQDLPSKTRQRVGSLQSTLQDTGTYLGHPCSSESSAAVEATQGASKPAHKSDILVPSAGGSRVPSQADAPAPAEGYLAPSSPSRINSLDALKQIGRPGSINTTLYQEVMHLQHPLQQRDEEYQAAGRSRDALMKALEARDADASKTGSRGSWSKGMWTEEVQDVMKERDFWKKKAEEKAASEDVWKKRAEEAEKRLKEAERKLAATRRQVEDVIKEHPANIDNTVNTEASDEQNKNERAAERGSLDLELLARRNGGIPERVIGIRVEEGGSREQEMNFF